MRANCFAFGSGDIHLSFYSLLSHGLHKSFEKVSSSGSGLPQISSAAARENKFLSWKIVCGPRQFDTVHMRSLHYAILYFWDVVDIFK